MLALWASPAAAGEGFGSPCSAGESWAPDSTGNNWYCNGNSTTVTYPAYWFGSTTSGCGTGTAGLMQWTGGTVSPNNTMEYCNGTSWTSLGAASGLALSGLTAATTGNTITGNANYAQIWSWGTLGSNTALALTTTDLTSGTILEVENTSGGNSTGYAGYFENITTGTGYALYALTTGKANTGYAGYFVNTTTTNTGYALYATNTGAGYALGATGTSYFNGSVGIGTATPTDVLTVSGGNINIASSTKALKLGGSNILTYPDSGADTTGFAIGVGALAGQTVTGAENLAIGYQALNANTTGTNNLAIGYQALESNTTGTFNVAVGGSDEYGVVALGNNTGGSTNVAIGDGALGANVSDSGNVAIGFESMWSDNGGGGNTANTAVGTGTLLYNGTGGYNTAIGSGAMIFTSGGGFNTAAGCGALMGSESSYSTGSQNVALGCSSMQNAASTADSNTAAGYLSLGNVSGNYNTTFGNSAGDLISSGSSNVVIGPLVASTTLQTGSNNILIGTSNLVDTTTSGTSNELNIGNTIYGNLSTGSVGIGTTSPAGQLDVESSGTYAGYFNNTAATAVDAVYAATASTTTGAAVYGKNHRHGEHWLWRILCQHGNERNELRGLCQQHSGKRIRRLCE